MKKHIPKSVNPLIDNIDGMSDLAHVRLPTVMALYACSSATVYRNVQKGFIPKPKKLSTRIVAWNVGELKAALSKEEV